jgi:hypothetical protein
MRTLCVSLLLLAALGGGPAWAQDERPVLFTIDAQPSGPAIALSGLETIVGETPVLIGSPLSGRYRLSVREPGFERPRGNLDFRATESGLVLERFDSGLRGQRALRSLLLPGLGQIHAGATARGVGYLSATSVLGVCTAISELIFLAERDDVSELRGSPSGATQDEIDARNLALLAESREQDDAYRVRNLFAAATAGVWGLSIVDALVFVPAFEVRLLSPELLTIQANRRTPSRAALRSLVMPGLGQFYSGSRFRGVVFLTAETAALAFAGYAHLRYEDANDEAEFYRQQQALQVRRGDAAGAEESVRAFRGAVSDRDDHYELRNGALAAAAAVWAFSLADVLLFGGEDHVKLSERRADDPSMGPRLECALGPQGPRFQAVLGF